MQRYLDVVDGSWRKYEQDDFIKNVGGTWGLQRYTFFVTFTDDGKVSRRSVERKFWDEFNESNKNIVVDLMETYVKDGKVVQRIIECQNHPLNYVRIHWRQKQGNVKVTGANVEEVMRGYSDNSCDIVFSEPEKWPGPDKHFLFVFSDGRVEDKRGAGNGFFIALSKALSAGKSTQEAVNSMHFIQTITYNLGRA